MYCSTCGDERDFEQPPCRDGHGSDCPERACTACGTAVLTGFPPPVEAGGTVRGPAAGVPAAGSPAPSARAAASAPSVPDRTSSQRAVA
ncbi:hypothetical protein ACFY4C_32405 [Actinomadura viridis]|uniref:hypothetical protein n=1 Tax=Actinomadura viridis TaxID=58110 RepID=UPI0036994DC3